MPKQGRETKDLGPGTYTYPFQFQLPAGIPASFDSSVGRVKYRVQAIVDIPWHLDIKTKTPFLVSGLLDLNLWPEMAVIITNLKNLILVIFGCVPLMVS